MCPWGGCPFFCDRAHPCDKRHIVEQDLSLWEETRLIGGVSLWERVFPPRKRQVLVVVHCHCCRGHVLVGGAMSLSEEECHCRRCVIVG